MANSTLGHVLSHGKMRYGACGSVCIVPAFYSLSPVKLSVFHLFTIHHLFICIFYVLIIIK